MAAYVLVHTVTGHQLAGYRLGAANQDEVQEANQRLAAAASPYRLRPVVQKGHTPRTLAMASTTCAA